MNIADVTFVLGGARSGKSEFGEALVKNSGLKPIYLATGRAIEDDEEMAERIELHRLRREQATGAKWETVEEPLALADALRNCAFAGRAVLVDCLTLWVNNLMEAGADVAGETAGLVKALDDIPAPVVFVSNEVGLGIVPVNAMAREFRDLAGIVNRKLAARADKVYFIAAGLPMILKDKG